MERRTRIAIAVSFILLSFPAALAQNDEAQYQSRATACPDRFFMPGVGDACEHSPGYYELFAPDDGRSLGFTHGPDPICVDCPEPEISMMGSTTPHCVAGNSDEYFVRVIYARAHDDTDRYSTMASQIRTLVANANAMVDDAAIATGDRLSIRVKCTSGIIDVANEVLPTSRGSATYNSVISDLQAKGYTSHRQKFWVYYDDAGACACAGIGHRYNDDSDSVNNLNNGHPSAIGMFAISFDSNSVRTMLHELGHNLGAVQDSAPRTTGAGHCYDGRDTMCYNDNGPNGHLYSTSYCSVEVFDCNKDTYCHANPAPGSYLDTRWQACHRQTRFLQYAANQAPVMSSLSCTRSPSNAEEPVTCSFSATDANVGVYYMVSWGDGSPTTRVPTVGTVTPGTTQTAGHTWTSQGSYTVSVTATDSGTPPETSSPRTVTQIVNPPNAPPVTTSLSCTPTSADEGDLITCSVTGTDATDQVYYTISWGDGSPNTRVPASGVVASGTTLQATHSYGAGGNYVVSATTTDDGGPPKTSAARTQTIPITEINTPPVMTSLVCPTMSLQVVDCSFAASDDSSGVQYRIEWGDGTTTFYPASGHVAPGPTRVATHSYPSDGNFTVNVSATDNFVPSATSGTLSALIRIQADQIPPSLTVSDPLNGNVYIGCTKTNKYVGNPVFVRTGCVKATASDASGIARVEVLYNGVVVASDSTAPYVLEFPTPGIRFDALYEIRAVDVVNNIKAVTVRVDTI